MGISALTKNNIGDSVFLQQEEATMPWNDDSWRDSYDSWKLASPDDYCDDPDPCDHEDYEINIVDGRCWCHKCGEVWHASKEEISLQIQHEAEYHEWERTQQRREFWLKLTRPIRWPIFRLMERIWPRHATRVLDDGEIPF
jgi:hypothetical protein